MLKTTRFKLTYTYINSLMDFIGLHHNKKSLYSEMKLYQQKQRSNTFETLRKGRPIKPTRIELTNETELLMDEEKQILPSTLLFYRDIHTLCRSFDSIMDKVNRGIQKRLKNTFGSSTGLDKEIEKNLEECYQIVKLFNQSLAAIPALDNSSLISHMINNIKMQFQTILKRKLKKLKKQEQTFFSKVKGLDKELGTSSFDFINQDHIDDSKRVIYNDQGQSIVLQSVSEHEQNEELIKMISTIDNLSKMLTQMSEVVFEQGAVIDRIDVNILSTVEKVKKGNLELVQAKEELEKGCAARLLKMLIVANCLIFLILVLKFK